MCPADHAQDVVEGRKENRSSRSQNQRNVKWPFRRNFIQRGESSQMCTSELDAPHFEEDIPKFFSYFE